MTKRALITGITGQDGSYLAELLLSKGYEVHGIIRRASTFNTARIDHIYEDPNHPGTKLFLHHGDLSSTEWILSLIYNLLPDELYHLAAQSHVKVSFDIPEYTGDITGVGTTRLLEAIRRCGAKTRFYQASSSEMFGSVPPPQSETTPFQPQSPYAAAKVYAHWMTRIYRDGYGLFAANGILFNHESPRRGETFVTRKITRGLASILAGKEDSLYLGNLDARRDWGYTPNMSKRCGASFSKTRLTISSSARAKRIPFASLSKKHSLTPASTGRNTSSFPTATNARSKSTSSLPIPAKRAQNLAGKRRSVSAISSPSWSMPISKPPDSSHVAAARPSSPKNLGTGTSGTIPSRVWFSRSPARQPKAENNNELLDQSPRGSDRRSGFSWFLCCRTAPRLRMPANRCPAQPRMQSL